MWDELKVVIQQMWPALRSPAGMVLLQREPARGEGFSGGLHGGVRPHLGGYSSAELLPSCSLSTHQEAAVYWVVSMLVISLIESAGLLP